MSFANTFVTLSDTPNVYVADSFLVTAANGNALAYADTDTLVLTTGDQTIAGEKVFTNALDINLDPFNVVPEALKVRSARATYNTRFIDEANPAGNRNLDILMQAVDGQPGLGARILYSAYGNGALDDFGNVVGGIAFETRTDGPGPEAFDSTIRFFTTPDLAAANASMSIDPVGVRIGAGPGSYRLPLADGTTDQVVTTNGSGQLAFSTLPPPGALELNELSDVTLTGLAGGESLVYDAANGVFVNRVITLPANVVIRNFIELDDTPDAYPANPANVANYVRVANDGRVVFDRISLGQADDTAFSYGNAQLAGELPQNGYIMEWDTSFVGSDNPYGGLWRAVRNDPYTVGAGLEKITLGPNTQIGLVLGNGLVSSGNSITLADTSVTPGVYGSNANTTIVTVNSKGQITDITETPIVFDFNTVVEGNFVQGIDDTRTIEVVDPVSNPAAYFSANGNVIATPGFTGLSLVATGVTAGTYGGQASIPVITVDTYGRIADVNQVDLFANIDFGNANIDGLTSRAWSELVIDGNTLINADDPQDTLFINSGDGIQITGVNDGPEDEITISVDGTVARNAFSQVAVLDIANVNTGWANADNSADTLELRSSSSITFVRSNTDANVARIEAEVNDSFLDNFLANASINDFGDVSFNAATIANTDVLAWNGANAQFEPQSLQVQQLGDIADVVLDANIASLPNNQILIYNVSTDQWENIDFNGSGGDGNLSLGAFSVNQLPNAGLGNLTYDAGSGTFTYTPPAPQTLSFDGPTSNLTISDGNTVNLSNISLANTGVTAGVYGSAGSVPVITVDEDGRISNVVVESAQAPGNAVERFRINYAPNGQLSLANNISSGIANVVIDNPAGGDVTITFDSRYVFPPTAIMFYGYNYNNNKYFLVPFDVGVALREIEGGGVQGNPDLFNGTSEITMRLRLREADTGASRGGFGTQSHAVIQFML